MKRIAIACALLLLAATAQAGDLSPWGHYTIRISVEAPIPDPDTGSTTVAYIDVAKATKRSHAITIMRYVAHSTWMGFALHQYGKPTPPSHWPALKRTEH